MSPGLRFDPADTALARSLRRSDGGWIVRELPDGRRIEVWEMLFNFRIIVTDRPGDDGHDPWPVQGYCYFGHGEDSSGTQRSMESAWTRAVLAAQDWDGDGEPPDHDKRAF